MRKTSGKGFTLIELIISIAILSIVGLAIFGFMATSSRIYGREVSQADLQYESQLVINQLQDMLIDASKSVTYFVTVGGTAVEVLNDAGIDQSAVTEKEVRIYNGDEYYRVTWNRSEERLYYTRYTASGGGGGAVAKAALGAGAVGGAGSWDLDPSANRVRMADYVREFSADITSLEKNRSVMFRFLFAVNDVSYATQHNITLRNKVVKGEGESGSLTVVTPKQDAIKIHPSEITLWPGDSVVFTHTVTSKNGGYPSQEADYSLSAEAGVPAPDTTLSLNGELNISMDEKCSDLTATVTVKNGVEQEDGSILRDDDKAKVHVKQVKGLGVSLTEGGTYAGKEKQRLVPGSTLQFEVSSINGPYVSMADLTATGVSIAWEMEKGAEYASVDASGMLTVSMEAPRDTVLQVKAVFHRAGREWAYGYGSEYKVVELKDRGLIFVDPGDGEYIAPEGEIWFPEEQRISINWDKLGEEWKNEDGTALKSGYEFEWKVTLLIKGEWKGRNDTQGMGITKSDDKQTENSHVKIMLRDWMQWHSIDDHSVEAIRIELEIYRINNWSKQLVFTSSPPLQLDIPRIKFYYSCTEGQDYTSILPLYVTKEVGEVCVYFYKYGDASDEVRPWEKFDNEDNGYYRLTNKENFNPIYEGNKRLDTDSRPRTIYFTPNADSGSSKIVHHTWQTDGQYEDTQVIIYFKKPNVEGEGYYVPLPGDTAYKDSGYLFGDCSYKITTESVPAGEQYYRLVITDSREKIPKVVTAYWKSGTSKQWQKKDPYAG